MKKKVQTIFQSAVFHKNLIAIAMFLFIHGYVHMTMRSVLILYQNNIIALDGDQFLFSLLIVRHALQHLVVIRGYISPKRSIQLFGVQMNRCHFSHSDTNLNNAAHIIAFIASMLRNYQTLAIMQLFPITVCGFFHYFIKDKTLYLDY